MDFLDKDYKASFAKNVESIQSLDRKFGDGMSVFDDINYKNTDDTKHVPMKTPFINTASTIEKNSKMPFMNKLSISNFTSSVKTNVNVKDSYSCDDFSELSGYTELTPRVKCFVPKSNKREEFKKSIQTSSNDKYFFNLHLGEVLPPIAVADKGKKGVKKNDKVKPIQPDEIIKTEEDPKRIKM